MQTHQPLKIWVYSLPQIPVGSAQNRRGFHYHYCQGGYGETATLENIIEAIADCKAVFVAKIGDCPKEKLYAAGIQTVETYDVIDKVALEYYQQYVQKL
ncbi:NifB/NifX family molybdenum-iron cluster-binding protein [Fischerella sp.]|uniref:NifB/NifX family molybdenum-iron cluster-binding protein n=1 Tax=Fischerella sp. TaxID=1191 RepID=UPI0025BC680C|nr:NifB/NifX family molybdenum-iron cluster-binding protein [Fischerella sp.]